MELIKTKTFKLATFSRGDKSSKRVAILLPGRLDSKDYINFDQHAKYLANKDFFIVAFDPPGTWESPGDISLFTTTNYIKAVNELIEYFGSKPTLLLGHSRGAATAILAGTNNPCVSGIISVMANFGVPTAPDEKSFKRGYQDEFRDMPPGIYETDIKKEFKLPVVYWEDGKKYNAGETLKKCSKPKLLVYGTEDEFTTPDEVKSLYKIIPEPKMLKEINSTHDYRYYPEAIEAVNEAVGEFLSRYLFA